MGVIIYLSGEATFEDLTDDQKEKILGIKKWDEPIFKISGDTLEYAYDEYEGLTPLRDYVENPLKEVLNIVGKDIEGLFFVSCADCRDYDNLAVFIEDGELIFRNAEIVNATTEELEAELKRRKGLI